MSIYSILIDTKNKSLTLYKDAEYFKTYPIAVGKSNTPTPKGKFKIISKSMNPGGPFGARWMGLSTPGGHYGIHGTNNPSSIGKNVSKGCVRLLNKNVIELYDIVDIGTEVEII